jgi:hypothetical protein
MKKSVFIVSPGNSDQDVKWGIWVTNTPVRNIDEALAVYNGDYGEEVDAYLGLRKDKALKRAEAWVKKLNARKRIVVI